MPAVSQKEMLNNAIATIQEQRREIKWLKKQVRDLLEVADNVRYADANGDWDILEAAARGASRMLRRRKTLKAVGFNT